MRAWNILWAMLIAKQDPYHSSVPALPSAIWLQIPKTQLGYRRRWYTIVVSYVRHPRFKS